MQVSFLFITIFICQIAFCQKNDLCLRVLQENKIQKKYTFDLSDSNGYNVVEITYLGKVIIKKTTSYKIAIGARIWGNNYHTTGNIFVYDNDNKYVGRYSLGGLNDLPTELQNNKLIFYNNNKTDCDSTLVTKIDFSDSIPKNIFIKCKYKGNESYGDLYSFTND